MNPHERLLETILSVVAVYASLHEISEQGIAMPAHKFAESFRIALQMGFNQNLVATLHHISRDAKTPRMVDTKTTLPKN